MLLASLLSRVQREIVVKLTPTKVRKSEIMGAKILLAHSRAYDALMKCQPARDIASRVGRPFATTKLISLCIDDYIVILGAKKYAQRFNTY